MSAGDDLKPVRDYWDRRARTLDNDCDRVESGRKGQRLRFEAFLTTHDLSGRSVLDLGCGVGDFFDRLRARKITADYHGLDTSPEMIRRARQRFPDGRFDEGDISGVTRSYDYTVAFAIHNARVDRGREILEETLRRQFAAAAIASHMSLLTDRYRAFDSHLQAWRAEEILTLALSLTPYVMLRHDYLPNDFSVTLYRRPLIDSDPALTADLA